MSGGAGRGAGGGGAGGGLAKADEHLRRELEEGGDPRRRLRVVVLLAGGTAEGSPDAVPAPPQPADYPDRTAWRRAMLEHRQHHHAPSRAPARRALEELGLEIRGGETSSAWVVDGPAEAIRRALELPAVRRVTIDRAVDPHRGG